jgi:glycosidase
MATKKMAPLNLRGKAHPLIYEVNTRVLLNELGKQKGKAVTLGSVPERVLDDWREMGFDAVWLMGVWTVGRVSREIARSDKGLEQEYRKVLPDVTAKDIGGSPYSVRQYAVPAALGGNAGLARLRSKLSERGIALVLDFVSNHSARDHPWVKMHPDYYIHGELGDEQRRPDLYFKVSTASGEAVLAYGRDPTFPGWTDTAQLNHLCLRARKAIIAQLNHVASMCDGIRCDMAMLLLRDVFLLTWGDRLKVSDCPSLAHEFWAEAIEAVRKRYPEVLFVAEAYWNLEWQLQQQGFDYTYDKVLYDRLLREGATAVRDHLRAERDFQLHSLRFIENHDEPRAASSFGSEAWHRAASVVMSTVPGSAMYHEGEFEGRRQHLPIQLTRRPQEPPSESLLGFYRRLLSVVSQPVFHEGQWKLLSVRPGWHENPTWQNFLVFWWQSDSGVRMVVVNYAPHSGQCYVEVPFDRLEGASLEFHDLMSEAIYVRDRGGLATRGMYFDLPGYGYHIFDIRRAR